MQIVIEIPEEVKEIADNMSGAERGELSATELAIFNAIRSGAEIPRGWYISSPETYCMSKDEVTIVRKILGLANTLYTVMDSEAFSESKVDQLVRRLRLWEETHE